LCDEVFDDAVGDAPPDEVELGNRGGQPLELDAHRPAEWVEQLLGVAVEARFVRDVHRERLAGRRLVGDVAILRVVGHEPLEVAQGDAVAVRQDGLELLAVLGHLEEARQRLE
jgi:hypothetical protein